MLGIGLACIKCAARAVVQIAGGGGTPPPTLQSITDSQTTAYTNNQTGLPITFNHN